MGKKIIVAQMLLLLFTFVCLLLVPQNALCAPAGKAENKWQWFSALAAQKGWRISKGSTDVLLTEGKLKAELYDEKNIHAMTIIGAIENDQIQAFVIVLGTAGEPKKVTGMIHKLDGGRTSVLLFEKFAGGLVIGITKEEITKKR